MTTNDTNDVEDLGKDAVQRIARVWQVDKSRTVWTEQGFDWWPGRFRVSVMAQKGQGEDRKRAWRLVIRTAFLKDVETLEPKTLRWISLWSKAAPTYAWVITPPEVAQKYEIPLDKTLHFQAVMYLRDPVKSWLPEFFARMAILQPIQAEIQADSMAELIGARPDASRPSERANPDFRDEMLVVAEAIYVPEGKKESKWKGHQEFSNIAEQYGTQDNCFGMGDESGLTLETPIGDTSALIRLLTDTTHPTLGNGLLATIQMPFEVDEQQAIDDCMWYNYFQSISWTDAPQLASWHDAQQNEKSFGIKHGVFYPNALYMPGLATNAALWQLGQAVWAREQFFGHLSHLTMSQVYEKRFGKLS